MSILTDLDKSRLEASYKYRQQLIQEAFKDGVPSKSRDVEVINKVLDSMDKAIYDRANIKLKHEDNQSKEAILELITTTLSTISKQQIEENRNIELDNSYLPSDMVDGEASIDPDQLSLGDIIDLEEEEEDDEEYEEMEE